MSIAYIYDEVNVSGRISLVLSDGLVLLDLCNLLNHLLVFLLVEFLTVFSSVKLPEV